MYELIIIWESGEKDIYTYHSEQKAEEAEHGMLMAFGNQINWTCVRRAH